jgi:hypothetical protein
VTGVALTPPATLPNGFRLASAPTAVASTGSAPVEVTGPYVQLGATRSTTYVDRSAQPGVRYQYSVSADDGSPARGAATLVGQSPVDPAAQVRATLTDLVSHGELSDTQGRRLRRLVTAVTEAPVTHHRQRAALAALGKAVSTSDADGSAAEDLGAAVAELARSTAALPRGCER